MDIVIIEYNAGNTQSVINALNRLGIEPILSNDYEVISKAQKVIFPGVGEASSTMKHLRSLNLDKVITELKQPVLGICLGMQLMCRSSEENNTDCLGIFDLDVKKFKPENNEQVPHMGWNTLRNVKSPLFSKSLEGEHMYFVHSYYVPQNNYSIADTNYITTFSAAVQKLNFYAVQFHPEKSSGYGSSVLRNFIEL